MLEEGKVPSTDEGEVRRDKEPPDAVFDERGVAERGEDGVGRPRRRARARRTVAKYRDQLGILPARMRKRV